MWRHRVSNAWSINYGLMIVQLRHNIVMEQERDKYIDSSNAYRDSKDLVFCLLICT